MSDDFCVEHGREFMTCEKVWGAIPYCVKCHLGEGKMPVTDHEMRMEALRLFEENERLREERDKYRTALEEILATNGDGGDCRGIAAYALPDKGASAFTPAGSNRP